jgi:hypothetical protein
MAFFMLLSIASAKAIPLVSVSRKSSCWSL